LSPSTWRRRLAAAVAAGALASLGLSCKPASSDRAEAAPAAEPPARARTETALSGRGRVIVPGGPTFAVEVVQDPVSRARGLQNRPALPPDQGMVFIFPAPGRHRFWMYECLIPLDIIWMDADKKVIHVGENLPFCQAEPCPDYAPDQDALFVLEVGAGIAKRSGIRPGMRLTILFDQTPHPR